MDINKLVEVVEAHLAGSDVFVVECTSTPSNEISLILDADSRVSIDTCVAVSRAVDAVFDRDVEDFSLTVASAGIGEPLKLLRQYKKKGEAGCTCKWISLPSLGFFYVK